MLVLSRKISESVIIGDNIRVTVVDIRADKVRIGIEADQAISIHREEIWLKVQQERRQRELDACGPPGRCGRAGCDGLLQTSAELRAGLCRDCQTGGL